MKIYLIWHTYHGLIGATEKADKAIEWIAATERPREYRIEPYVLGTNRFSEEETR